MTMLARAYGGHGSQPSTTSLIPKKDARADPGVHSRHALRWHDDAILPTAVSGLSRTRPGPEWKAPSAVSLRNIGGSPWTRPCQVIAAVRWSAHRHHFGRYLDLVRHYAASGGDQGRRARDAKRGTDAL